MQIKMTRRQFAGGAAAATGALLAGVRRGRADTYPQKPVTIVNPFAPGSISDAAARIVGQSLQQELGQPFVVENKVGAGGLLAATTVQRAQPDGYTLMLTASSSFSGAALYKSMPFDPVKDFTHIARIGSFPSFIAVNPGVPAETMAALVAYAKANPGKLSYGHGNNVGQLVGETLKKRTGVDIVRVAYRSNPAAVTDLIAGHIQIMVPDLNTGLPSVKSGKIRALAMLNHGRVPADAGRAEPARDRDAGLRHPALVRVLRPRQPAAAGRRRAGQGGAEGAGRPDGPGSASPTSGVGLFPGGPQEFTGLRQGAACELDRGDQRDGDPTGITATPAVHAPQETFPRRPLPDRPRPVRHRTDQEEGPHRRVQGSAPRQRNGREAGGARQPLPLRDQQPLDHRRFEPQEPRPLRQPFLPAELRGASTQGKVFIRAIKAIKPGEEITWNYGRDYFVNVITPSGCKCVKCREKRNKRRRELALAAKRRAKRAAKA